MMMTLGPLFCMGPLNHTLSQKSERKSEAMLMPNASEKLPEVKHSYQNHWMDSLRWNFFSPRADDIVVATSIRAGTTWVLAIVGNLISSGKRTSAAQAQARLGQVAECNKGTA